MNEIEKWLLWMDNKDKINELIDEIMLFGGNILDESRNIEKERFERLQNLCNLTFQK